MAEKYIAFISYRHKPLDMAVAEELVKMIERYVVPKEFRKDPAQKYPGKVFRDMEEIRVSNDLTQDIRDALDESRYLIVICTPDTPHSEWVPQEIEYFISRHGRERVLTVLAAGTTEISVPPEITQIKAPDGTVLEYKEPRVAFLVDDSQKKILKNLKKEFPQLISALIDCPLDALLQRMKRYRIQQFTIGLGIAVAILLAFVLMLWNRNTEIKNHLRQSKINETAALSLLSQAQLAQGDRYGALQSAVNALPSDTDDRPYNPDAEYALTNALHPYGNGNMEFDTTIRQETEIYEFDLSEDGKSVVTIDANGCIRCFDTATGVLRWSYQIETEEGYRISMDMELFSILESSNAVLYQEKFSGYLLSLDSGAVLRRYDYSGDSMYSPEYALSDNENYMMEYYRGFVTQNQGYEAFYQIYDASTMEYFCWASVQTSLDQGKPCISEKHMKMAIPLYEYGNAKLEIGLFDLKTFEFDFFVDVPLDIPEDMDETIHADDISLNYLEDGTLLVYTSNWDSDSDQTYYNVFWYDRDGTLLHSISEQFSHETTSLYLLGSYLTETHAVFVHSNHFVSVDLENRKTQYHVERPDTIEGHYMDRDDHLVLLLFDGTAEVWRIDKQQQRSGRYIECPFNMDVAMGCEAEQELCCIVPYDDPSTLRVVRGMGSGEEGRLEQPQLSPQSTDLSYVDIYPFPSGNYLLAVDDHINTDSTNYFTVYDAETRAVVDQFQFAENLENLAFSEDETQLVLNGYIYDLETHSLHEFDSAAAAFDAEKQSGNYISAENPQKGDAPALSAALDEENNLLHLWTDGTQYCRVPLPKGDHYFDKGNIVSSCYKLAIGNNGLVVLNDLKNMDLLVALDFKTGVYLVYSMEEERWTALPNDDKAVIGVPVIAVGDEEPIFAAAGYDQVLRIYDQSQETVSKEYSLPVTAESIARMQFLMGDQILAVLQESPDAITFVNMEDGTVLGQFHPGIVNEDTRLQVDAKTNRLYVTVPNGIWNGLCIDMDTWSVVAEIPGLLCLIPGTDRIVQMDFLYTGLTIRPMRTLDQLLEESRQLLELHTPAQVP